MINILIITYLLLPLIFNIDALNRDGGNSIRPLPSPITTPQKEQLIGPPKIPERTYFIIAPRFIRPGRPYEVSISLNNIMEPVSCNIIIRKNKENVIRHPAEVTPGSPLKVTFQIPISFTNDKYQLIVLGMTRSWNFVFYNETKIEFQPKTASIFVQTDKAIYKAGQLVRFRIIMVDTNLRPYKSSVAVYVLDGQKNRIKQWLNMNGGIYGVIKQEFQLSDQPVLGTWTIVVEFLGSVIEKTFSVEEYVLPKYEVSVELPKFASLSDDNFIATIKAKYTFGKPVTGKAIIRAATERTSQIIYLQFIDIIDGTAQAIIPLKALEMDIPNYSDDFGFKITAIVTEKLTNATQNGTNSLTVYRHKAKIEIIKPSENFRPGLDYKLKVKVTSPDGLPLPGQNNRLNVTYYFTYSEENSTSQLYAIGSNGIVELVILPTAEAQVIRIKAKYGDVVKEEYINNKFKSPSSTFIKVTTLTENIMIDSSAEFEILSTSPLSSVNVVILARGNIISGGFVNGQNKNQIRFQIRTTQEMSPSSRIIIYYVRDDGEVVADASNFAVNGALRNKISLSFFTSDRQSQSLDNSSSVEPNSKVRLTGITSPSSYVGCLAVDQSVLLLKSGNDLSENQILEELDSYDTAAQNRIFLPLFSNNKPQNPNVFGTDVKQILQNSGVIVLTNAYIYDQFGTSQNNFRPVFFGAAGAGAPLADNAEVFTTPASAAPGAPSGPGIAPTGIIVRKFFPETWIWFDTISNNDGTFNNLTTVPDTITSWVATAFSIDQSLGLGLTPAPTMLGVFKQFFVSMNLPYSVIRGETLLLQVLVFSYLDGNNEVIVELESNPQFDIDSSYGEKFKNLVRKVQISSGVPQSLIFPIIPKIAGSIDLKVTGRTDKAGDAEQKPLLVKPEGVIQHFNIPIFIDLKSSTNFNTAEKIIIPNEGVVPGSERAEVTVIGDLIGLTLRNLDVLVRMPYGCGEQNMINFVPNIVVLNYLQATRQLTDEIVNKAIGFLELGYQRELTYKRSDGSFSAFGNSDGSGSTFLTSFVMRSLVQASTYITIDYNVISAANKWLSNKQSSDGSFIEVGRIIDTELQGGLSKGASMTAYVLISLVENKTSTEFLNIITKAQSFLEQQLNTIKDSFVACIVSYALHLVKSPRTEESFQMLNSLAINEGGLTHWGSPDQANSETSQRENPFRRKAVADVEMTGYALLTYLLRKDASRATPIARWLASKRNNFGGFQSTQDTVIGLQALAEYEILTFSPDLNINLRISSGQTFSQNFLVTRDNALVLQSAVIPNGLVAIDISSSGIGSCLAQVSWQYNIGSPFESNAFKLTLSIKSNDNGLILDACISYNDLEPTGMVVMEIILPSGYTIERDSFHENEVAQRVESKNSDTEAYIYFNEITANEVCFTIKADRLFIVDKLKDVPVTVYEYYKPEKRTTKLYKPEK